MLLVKSNIFWDNTKHTASTARTVTPNILLSFQYSRIHSPPQYLLQRGTSISGTVALSTTALYRTITKCVH
jgi:hypothetical protein